MTAKLRTSISALSKSRYILGLQCPKALWLTTYQPELKDEVCEAQEAIFQSGADVGVLARDLFSSGVEIPYEGLTPAEQLERTRQALADGVKIIYEAAFRHNGLFVKVDLLRKGRKGWELHEVKGSTGLKEVYLNDIAVQYYVVTGAGLQVSTAGLVHINNQYVRQGDIEVKKLFAKQDLTAEIVARQPEVTKTVAGLQKMLACDMPAVGIGPHCSDPYGCPFFGHCWAHVPSPSVFDLRSYGKPRNLFSFYEKGQVRFEELPLHELGWRQRQQVEAHLGQELQVDTAGVHCFLETVQYPLSFLDFETTYLTPMPLFDGTWPYQQVPFQYSLHVINRKGGKVKHHALLADPDDGDPRTEFIEHLLADLPVEGTILAWNMTFEKQRLQELAAFSPEHAPAINRVIARLVDLIVPFRNRSVYDWRMEGSASLKAVLPALIPELSYDELEVTDGGAASAAWLRMMASEDAGEKERLRQALLDYCHLDTLAMVRILEWLRKRAS